jgi:hypothetical protein
MPRGFRIISRAVTFALVCGIGCSGSRHESFNGCRSPSEPGCATCCEETSSGCSERAWAPGGVTTEIEPWYNQVSGLDGPCPTTCAPCASCLLRNEQDLRARGCRADCNCASIAPTVDPCFGPSSCECYCFQVTGLKARCPAVLTCL